MQVLGNLENALGELGVSPANVLVQQDELLVFAPKIGPVIALLQRLRGMAYNVRVYHAHHPDRAAMEVAFLLAGLEAVELRW